MILGWGKVSTFLCLFCNIKVGLFYDKIFYVYVNMMYIPHFVHVNWLYVDIPCVFVIWNLFL